MRADRVMSVRLNEREWVAFMDICRRNRLSRQDFLHAIVVDALIEEGYDALRRKQSKGHSRGAEAG